MLPASLQRERTVRPFLSRPEPIREAKTCRRMWITEAESQASFFLLLKVSGLRAGLNLGPKGAGHRVLCPFSVRAALEHYNDLKELKSC